MSRYLARRLLELIPLLVLISVLSFALLVSMPGDPLDMLAFGNPNLSAKDLANLRNLYGLDDPMPLRYAKWMGQVLQGNFGFSRAYHVQVSDLVVPRMLNTVLLTGLALIIGLLFSIPLGIYSAVKQYSVGDYLGTLFAFLGFAVPSFWLALVLLMFFSVYLRWLPPGGMVSVDAGPGVLDGLVDRLQHLVMPVIVLSLNEMASWTRYMRSSLLEVIRQEYIQTARAKGLAESHVISRHALKNALIPVITLIGFAIPRLFSGSIIIETIFSYPGIGYLLYSSIIGNDFSVAMAILMVLAALIILGNLMADVLYAVVDPRISYA